MFSFGFLWRVAYLAGVTEYLNIGFGSSGVFLCPDVFLRIWIYFDMCWCVWELGYRLDVF